MSDDLSDAMKADLGRRIKELEANPNDVLTWSQLLERVNRKPPMIALIRRLDARLAELRPEYYAQLLPGLTDAEWGEFESRLGVPMPAAFRALYQWRNGQRDDANFLGNRMWMCAEDVIGTKELMDSMIGSDFEPGWWERGRVPFLHNGAGSHLCVDAVGANGNPPGCLVEFWNCDHDRPVVAQSLEVWLDQFVTSLERDRWAETRNGFECVEKV